MIKYNLKSDKAERKRIIMITGKRIVLTGCNSGIGLEFLKLLVRGGNEILAVDKQTDRLEAFDPAVVHILKADVSSKEAVDLIFETAETLFPFIDIFYANAGYPYFEEMNYADWDRVAAIFETNVFSPIYSYQKYVRYLRGRSGVFAVTVSAIGEMAMPGYTLYSASKFAMHGFQQGIRFEKPKNVQLTCLYPVATDTNFFRTANPIMFRKPFPVQRPQIVAKKMMAGIENGKNRVSPCTLFGFAKILMGVCPPVRTVYMALEKQKFNELKRDIENGAGRPWPEEA